MSNIELTCFDGKMVTPKNDAITLDMIVGQSGIISGCELTFLGANQVLMSECEGLIKGRRFNAPEQTLLCQMSDAGSIPGRIYIRMDLSDTETPIDIITVAAESLPELECDEDCNYTNGVYEIELATYTANETAIKDLTVTYSIVRGSDVLDTLEEIEANTSPGKVAGALAVQELNQSLTSNLNMRYNVLEDTIEIQIDGVWTKWKDAGMKAYNLLKDGVVHQDAGTIEKYNSSQYPNAPTSAEIVNGRLKVYGSYSDGNYNGMLTAFFSNIIDCTGFSKITVVVDELTQNGGSSNYCYLVKTNSKAFSTSTKIGDLTVGTNTFSISTGQGYIGVTDRNYTVLISEMYLHN